MSRLRRSIGSLLSVLVVVLSFGCTKVSSQEEARALAEVKLREYAQSQGVSVEKFGEPSPSSEPGHPWIFDYESSGTPHQLVRIYVGKTGGVELHRMIEE